MFRKRISWISFVWVVSSGWMISIATAAPPASLPAAESSLHGFALLDTDHLQECSGVIASRVNPDVLWMHDDSGSAGPRVWAVRLDASDLAAGVARELGWVELAGATNDDWEDISGGPGHSLYIFDGGDNPPCRRKDKRILRFNEPRIDAARKFHHKVAWESLRFEFPDSADPTQPADEPAERYDAECLMVHPQTGDIYVVTKRDTHGRGVARAYKLPAPRAAWNRPTIGVLAFVADLTSTLGVQESVASTVTGGDISPDGERMMIRRYGFAFEFTRPPTASFDAVFHQQPAVRELPGELQGEGICYAPDARRMYTTSEVVKLHGVTLGPTHCPIRVWALPPATQPARATSQVE